MKPYPLALAHLIGHREGAALAIGAEQIADEVVAAVIAMIAVAFSFACVDIAIVK
jgi:hypothetical protein